MLFIVPFRFVNFAHSRRQSHRNSSLFFLCSSSFYRSSCSFMFLVRFALDASGWACAYAVRSNGCRWGLCFLFFVLSLVCCLVVVWPKKKKIGTKFSRNNVVVVVLQLRLKASGIASPSRVPRCVGLSFVSCGCALGCVVIALRCGCGCGCLCFDSLARASQRCERRLLWTRCSENSTSAHCFAFVCVVAVVDLDPVDVYWRCCVDDV